MKIYYIIIAAIIFGFLFVRAVSAKGGIIARSKAAVVEVLKVDKDHATFSDVLVNRSRFDSKGEYLTCGEVSLGWNWHSRYVSFGTVERTYLDDFQGFRNVWNKHCILIKIKYKGTK